MNTFRTGLAAYIKVLPLFILIEAMLLGAEYFGFDPNIGIKLVVHALAVFYLHLVILTGEFSWTGKAQANPSFGFFGLVLLLLGVPLIIALVLGLSLPVGGGVGVQTVLIVATAMVLIWGALSVFGTALPRSVMRQMDKDAEFDLATRPVQMAGVALWIAVWTVLYGVIVVVPFIWLGAIIPAGSWIEWAMLLVVGILGYFPTAIVAAVLSHAFLRANGRPPQGLVTAL